MNELEAKKTASKGEVLFTVQKRDALDRVLHQLAVFDLVISSERLRDALTADEYNGISGLLSGVIDQLKIIGNR